MDPQVILAVAGSGKTRHIVESLQASEKSLVVTYTENNYRNLYAKIGAKYGCIPDHIRLCTYFSFLYSFCLRPLLANEPRIRGVNWNVPPKSTQKVKRTDHRYYLDSGRRLYYSRMARFIEARNLTSEVGSRLSKYFDCFYVDEVQDFAGHDFNFLCNLSRASARTLLVGDFYQHTYDTSRDGNVNKNLHKDLDEYKARLRNEGFKIDDTSLGKSHRCSPTVCEFVSQHIGIDIQSHRDDQTAFEYVEDQTRAEEIFHQPDVVKLFYQ